MLKTERQAHILHQVNLHNRVMVADLCGFLHVSEDTIRRDLLELSEKRELIKIHGGALSLSFQAITQPAPIYSLEKKRQTARKALAFIRPGMFVLTSGGTTIHELAKLLPQHLKATFLTPSLTSMVEYVRHPNIEAIFIGSKVSKTSLISVGLDTVEQLRNIRADLCILGVNAIDSEFGITDNDWEVVQVKKAMIASSATVIALTIAEKLNTVYPIKVCETDEIDILITDANPQDPSLERFRNAGVQVV
jgi:DeoR/GlpR family transcriptional regulator of sugar metabolism